MSSSGGKRCIQTLHGMRLEICGGRKALLMPQFDTPARDDSTLVLVEQCLRERFVALNLMHGDVRRGNVGVYKRGAETNAVVFDLE